MKKTHNFEYQSGWCSQKRRLCIGSK